MTDKMIQQYRFLTELEKLKTVTRMNRTLDGRAENSAEHSWNASLMALVLREYAPKDVDIFRVVSMLLIHDIVEIDTGDTFLYDESARSEVVSEEKAAAVRIFSLLPEPLSSECTQLWVEFEDNLTPDATYAKAIDGLNPLINHPVTREHGDRIGSVSRSKVIEKKQFIRDVSPDLWKIALHAIDQGMQKELWIDE